MIIFSKTVTNTCEHKIKSFTIEQKNISINLYHINRLSLCKVCDKYFIENESKFNHYIATLTKEFDKSFYKIYTIINPNLNEVDKILNDYITKRNKNFDIYSIICEFDIVFDNNLKSNIETGYCLNIDDITEIKSLLLFWIEYYKLQGNSFCNIDKLIIKTIFDRCNMTYKEFMKQPVHTIERKLNFVIDENPELINTLNWSENHPMTRKFSHTRK